MSDRNTAQTVAETTDSNVPGTPAVEPPALGTRFLYEDVVPHASRHRNRYLVQEDPPPITQLRNSSSLAQDLASQPSITQSSASRNQVTSQPSSHQPSPVTQAPDNNDDPVLTPLSLWTTFLSYASLPCILAAVFHDARPLFLPKLALLLLVFISIISLLFAMSRVGQPVFTLTNFIAMHGTAYYAVWWHVIMYVLAHSQCLDCIPTS
ncbi:uncharacterized protein EV420DRAFT_1560993 [Desarmillaria tabescens]|uniref:Uncharacterized protein n=1 Tax=Armillaria tabescens TaxID=1929756 RepID=A0AA39JZ04_ARMTA|nr:uncharacterized protein EV420DRAFT_1560993 [Desarmillaria tabescens]KAK0451439.1 hypothetical protein EV420DRAFT_1560993 [Desarmillaria tabescens]